MHTTVVYVPCPIYVCDAVKFFLFFCSQTHFFFIEHSCSEILLNRGLKQKIKMWITQIDKSIETEVVNKVPSLPTFLFGIQSPLTSKLSLECG